MRLYYQSGEEIKKGDHVLFHLAPAIIERVATDANDSESRYYVEEDGGGVLIREPNDKNLTFIPADQLADCEDLEFVSREEPE